VINNGSNFCICHNNILSTLQKKATTVIIND